MEAFCVFCLMSTTNFGHTLRTTPEKNEIMSRFFKFLERYLTQNDNEISKNSEKDNESDKEERTFWLFNTFLSGELSACESCAKIMKSFCDLYHDLNTIQLLLNLQLWTLNNLLKTTGSASSFNGDSDKENLLQVRGKLLQKCSRKLLISYPRLILQRSPNIIQVQPNQTEIEGSPNSPEIKSEFSESNSNVSLPPHKSRHFTSKRPKLRPASKHWLSRKILKRSFKLVRKIQNKSNSNVYQSSNYVESSEVKCEAETKNETEHSIELLNTIPSTLIPNVIKIVKEDADEATQEDVPEPEPPADIVSIEENTSFKESCEQRLGMHSFQDENDQSKSDMPASSPFPGEEKAPTLSSPRLGSRYVRKQKKKFGCSWCPKSYNCKNRAREHMFSKHPNHSASSLNSSKRLNNSYRFKCPACKSFFKEIHFLLQHWKDTHSKEEATFGTPQTGSNKLIVEIITFKVIPESNFFKTLDPSATNSELFATIEVPLLKPGMNISICKMPTCQRPYYCKEDLEAHQKLHGRFTCAICPETREYLPELSDHEVKAHGGRAGRQFKCQRCEMSFTDFAYYTRHHASHFSLEFVEESCPVCKTYYSHEKTFPKFNHMKTAHDLNNLGASSELHICKEVNCNAYFLKGFTLSYHMRVEHCKKTGGVCEKCGKYFKDDIKIQKHRLTHLGPQSWEFCCETCGKKCITKPKLEEHMRTHSNEKPFVCQVCGAKYAHRHNLRIHVNNKHGDVMQDIPQRYNAANLTSRKGVKSKKAGQEMKSGAQRKRRKVQNKEKAVGQSKAADSLI